AALAALGAAVAATVALVAWLGPWRSANVPSSTQGPEAELPTIAIAPSPSTEPRKLAGPVLEMVSIPAGEFEMGSPAGDPSAGADEKPRHSVRITRGFRRGKTEVTQAQYQEVMGANPSAFSAGGTFKAQVQGKDTRDWPVESVRWIDAVRFCNRLS